MSTTNKKTSTPRKRAANAAGRAKPSAPSPTEAGVAAEHIQEQAERFAAMTTAERLREIARHREEAASRNRLPGIEIAADDMLATIQAAGTEFLRRYYPDADYASLVINFPEQPRSALVPIGVPSAVVPIPMPPISKPSA